MSALRIMAVVAAVAVLSQPVSAAEMSSEHDWSGVYLGGHLGGGVGIGGGKMATSGFYAASGYWNTGNDGVARTVGARDLTSGVVDVGIKTGYNYQMGNFVPGIEFGLGLFKTQASQDRRGMYVNAANLGKGFDLHTTIATDWMLSVVPKLGYAIDRFLFQGGVGLALTRIRVSHTFNDDYNTHESGSGAELKPGLMLSGAASYALSEAWAVKGEYAFTDFGRVHSKGSIGANPVIDQSFDLQAHTLRLGVDYRF